MEFRRGAGDGTNRAQLYDPATGSFGPTGSMVEVRGGPQATLLMNGLVLVIGGQGPPYGAALATAELYAPDDGVFRSTGAMTGCHWAATLLSNGMVLVVGSTYSARLRRWRAGADKTHVA